MILQLYQYYLCLVSISSHLLFNFRLEFAGVSECSGDLAGFLSSGSGPAVCNDLKSATCGVSRNHLIGEGGFDCVYKGVVDVNFDKIILGILSPRIMSVMN